MDSFVLKTKVTQNEDTYFACDDCQTVFDSNDLFEKHCLTCGENKPHICLWCHLVFKREEELTEHELTVHQQETETEHELTAHEEELTVHEEETETEVKDEENFDLKQPPGGREEVTRINEGANERVGLTDISCDDLPKETEKKPHVCEQCSVAFVDLQSFANHMESHSVGRGIICPVCNSVFQTEHDLNRHISLHAQNDDTRDVKLSDVTLIHNKLDSSEEKFSSTVQQEVVLPSVNQTVLLHDTSKPLHCEMCGKSFTSKSGLRKHKRKHCSTNHTVQMCTKCGETFKTKPQLDTHVLKTHGTQNFETVENLLVSRFPESNYNAGQNHYQCEMCNKSFKNRSGLTRHQVSHGTDKFFFCHLCGKRFKRKSHLQRHEITHDKREKYEKPHTCETCDKHFTEKAGLKRHEFVHRDEKPHKCEKCEESFTRKDSLMQHMVRKHDQVSHIPDVKKYMIENACAMIHQCDQCDKSFAYKPFLTQHKLQQHIGTDVIGSSTVI